MSVIGMQLIWSDIPTVTPQVSDKQVRQQSMRFTQEIPTNRCYHEQYIKLIKPYLTEERQKAICVYLFPTFPLLLLVASVSDLFAAPLMPITISTCIHRLQNINFMLHSWPSAPQLQQLPSSTSKNGYA